MVILVLSSLLLRSDKSEHSSSRLVKQFDVGVGFDICESKDYSKSHWPGPRCPHRKAVLGSRHAALMLTDSSVLIVSGHSSNLSANLTRLFPVSSPKLWLDHNSSILHGLPRILTLLVPSFPVPTTHILSSVPSTHLMITGAREKLLATIMSVAL